MKSEDIDNEIRSRLDEPKDSFDKMYNGGFAEGFEEGADWRIGVAWHDAAEEPEQPADAVGPELILKENENGGFSVDMYVKGKWEKMVQRYGIVRWAYIRDLVPARED